MAYGVRVEVLACSVKGVQLSLQSPAFKLFLAIFEVINMVLIMRLGFL